MHMSQVRVLFLRISMLSNSRWGFFELTIGHPYVTQDLAAKNEVAKSQVVRWRTENEKAALRGFIPLLLSKSQTRFNWVYISQSRYSCAKL